jgi:hypothetical protein
VTVETYTVDASALLVYLVDALPPAADRVFSRAEVGETTLEVPVVAAVETMYRAEKGVTVRGTTVAADAADIVTAFEEFLPVVVVDDEASLLRSVLPLMDGFPSQMHDAMILASHRNRGTDAVVTADGEWDAHAETVWR